MGGRVLYESALCESAETQLFCQCDEVDQHCDSVLGDNVGAKCAVEAENDVDDFELGHWSGYGWSAGKRACVQ